jgi:hypothetical protein
VSGTRVSASGTVQRGLTALAAAVALAFAPACKSVERLGHSTRVAPKREAPVPARIRDEIMVCGRRVPIGAPVVLWSDERGHDAYRGGNDGLGFRYGRRRDEGGRVREVVPADTRDTATLGQWVDQVVLHYDVAGTSKACFDALRGRNLSAHFLLDADGTIYQTLDVREEALHAKEANPRSIGIEMAHIGAYPPGDPTLREWYPSDARGPWIRLPERYHGGGFVDDAFVGRPARPEAVRGTVHGRELVQYDYTEQQYRSLVKLVAGLCRALPKIEPRVPRDAAGAVPTGVLADAQSTGFAGILGHWHLQPEKIDPGPAFDWERFERDLQAELAGT